MIELQQWMRRTLLALLVVLGGVDNALAFSYVMMRDADLLAQSEFVAVGTVRDTTDIADSTGMIVATRYRIEVERGIKGELARLINVDVPGVREPQGGRMWLPSAPHFFVEDRALWFLEKLDENRYQPMQYALGVFKLRRWENKDFAVRSLRGTAVLPEGGPDYQEPSNVRNLNGFIDYLKALKPPAQARRSRAPQRNAAPVTADYFVTDELQRAEIAGELARSFTFISSGERIFRWPDFDSGGTVQWRSNGGDSYTGRVAEATAAWTNAVGSTISLAYAGTTSASAGLISSDGINTVLFEDPNNEIGGAYSCSSGGTIGIGGPRASGTHVADGIEYFSTVEGDVVFQDGASCLLDKFSGANAAESITHEIGHATGFAHSCGDDSTGSCDDNPSGDDEAVMRATLHGDGRGARLGADDVAGAASLYPGVGVGSPVSLVVSSLSDSGSGSLREAISGASDGDTVGFDSTVFPANSDINDNVLVTLNTAVLIDKNIVIDGDLNGDGIADVAISGVQGIFELSTPITLQLFGLHLTKSDASRGAAVLIDGGGELTIADSVLSNNNAVFGGAVAVLDGRLTVRDSEFFNNGAIDGAAIAVYVTAGPVDIQRTTFIGNSAVDQGGALYNAGASSSLANVTVYDNAAGFGGGLFNAQGAVLTANNITVFNNVGEGIGITGGTVLLSNSLVAQVGAEDIAIVISDGEFAASFSLIESISGEFQNLGGNLFDLAPDFAADAVPGNYGGPTRTLSPSSLSAVLDAADANTPGAGGTCEIEDQTGKSRPIDGDADGAAICDMGAFEFSLTSGAPPSASSIEIVQEQYIAFYGRAGDPVGVQFWATRLDQLGGVLASIQNDFGNSQEFIELIVPDGLTTIEELTIEQKATLINNLYINMFARNVEGSATDPTTGLGFWVSELDRPEVSLIDISTRIADGAQNIDSIVLASRVALAKRITVEFVAQDKAYTGQFVEPVRSFIFGQIDDENDDAQAVDVTLFIAGLAN